MLAPVNLRPADWRGRPVANFSVTARVSTSRRHRAGPASALRSITAQTSRNKGTRTGIALIAALERTGLSALWAKQSVVVLQPLTRNRDLDIALLANIGWLEQAPTFGPEAGETTEVWFSAPARAPLSLCIGVVAVDGRPRLVLRYPHRLFSDDAARRFADGYLAQLRAVAAEDGVSRRDPRPPRKRFRFGGGRDCRVEFSANPGSGNDASAGSLSGSPAFRLHPASSGFTSQCPGSRVRRLPRRSPVPPAFSSRPPARRHLDGSRT